MKNPVINMNPNVPTKEIGTAIVGIKAALPLQKTSTPPNDQEQGKLKQGLLHFMDRLRDIFCHIKRKLVSEVLPESSG